MDPKSPELADDPQIDTSDPSLNTAEVCRLFWRKVDYFIRMVRDEMVFGYCKGLVLVVEFQKRGLPHAHAILTLAEKIRTPEQVDDYCTTAIPDKKDDPELFNLVTTKMVHQECGPRCMRKGKCAKGYPMEWQEETLLDDSRGFVKMKRPFEPHPQHPEKPAQTFKLGKKTYDRRSIVPYNPFLLRRLGCHVNIVPVNSFRQISYLFKYVFKGGDLAQLELNWKPTKHKMKVSTFNFLSPCHEFD
jgi:Helitron helicase-like domain at N-terminus